MNSLTLSNAISLVYLSKNSETDETEEQNTFEVTLEVPCVIGQRNLTTVGLELQTETLGSLARVLLLVFQPMTIVKATWREDATTTSEGTGGYLALLADRPWDLYILAGAISPSLRCNFGNSSNSEVKLVEGAVVCTAPLFPGDLTVNLTLIGGDIANEVTMKPFTVTRRFFGQYGDSFIDGSFDQ